MTKRVLNIVDTTILVHQHENENETSIIDIRARSFNVNTDSIKWSQLAQIRGENPFYLTYQMHAGSTTCFIFQFFDIQTFYSHCLWNKIFK